jgi:hypothetical protein
VALSTGEGPTYQAYEVTLIWLASSKYWDYLALTLASPASGSVSSSSRIMISCSAEATFSLASRILSAPPSSIRVFVLDFPGKLDRFLCIFICDYCRVGKTKPAARLFEGFETVPSSRLAFSAIENSYRI